ncbi:MAG: hypothetical protein AB1796_14450 [Bacillota bacterium]
MTRRAKKLISEVLLSIPQEPQPEQSLRFIMPALDYFRREGTPAELCRSLLIAADSYWSVGQSSISVELAGEGLALVSAVKDRELEARLALILWMACRDGYLLKEAAAALQKAKSYPQKTDCLVDALVLKSKGRSAKKQHKH